MDNLRAENERLRRAMKAAQQFCDAGAYHTASIVLSDALAEPPRAPEPLCGVTASDDD